MSHGRLWKLGIFAEQKCYYQSNGSCTCDWWTKNCLCDISHFYLTNWRCAVRYFKDPNNSYLLIMKLCNHLKSESHLELLDHEKFVLRITMIKQKMRRQLVCKAWVCTRKPLSIFRKNWKCHNIKTDAPFVEQLYMVPWTRLIIVYMAIAIEQQ